MSFTIRQATRQGVKPIIDLYSESGCGKTYSALLLARGFVGPAGDIVLVDSESGRGSLYADVLPGGYRTMELTEFSPDNYVQAIQAVEQSGAKIGILDSGSHEWENIGGVLDMAAKNEAESHKAGLHNWRIPKMEHQKFVLQLLRSPLPWIVCLRAKYKSRQLKGTPEMAESGEIRRDQIGKTIILKDDHTSPIQAEDFIFESTAHAEILPDHSIHLTKCSHPELRKCFPEKGPITIEHGKLIAQWCSTPGTGTVQSTTTADPKRELLAELWKLAEPVRGPIVKGQKPTFQIFEVWAAGQSLIGETEEVSAMTIDRLREVIEKAKEKLPK